MSKKRRARAYCEKTESKEQENTKYIINDSRTVVRQKIKLIAIGEEQRQAIQLIKQNQIVFIYGIPGTGKTYIPVIYGLRELLFGKYDKLVFTRPCVEANGEKLGMLPGGYDDKIAPYMIPIFDIIGDKMPLRDLRKFMDEGRIKTLPLAYLRGITFNNSFVVADESQNTTPQQMRLLLTRLGKDSKIVITGDLNQTDIPGRNGLKDAIERLTGISEIASIEFTEKSMVRNPIIPFIEEKYSQ